MVQVRDLVSFQKDENRRESSSAQATEIHNPSTHLFVKLIIECLYVLGTVLSAWCIAVNKTQKSLPSSQHLNVSWATILLNFFSRFLE